jgi:hypothetical protein
MNRWPVVDDPRTTRRLTPAPPDEPKGRAMTTSTSPASSGRRAGTKIAPAGQVHSRSTSGPHGRRTTGPMGRTARRVRRPRRSWHRVAGALIVAVLIVLTVYGLGIPY